MSRSASTERNTKETKIKGSIELDGKGVSDISTGIGFLDHMLDLLARHSGMDLMIRCDGDLNVDGHHTTEDIGIVIGKLLAEALGEKRGINRYGFSSIPMDEALAQCSLDISGRPFLVLQAEFGGEYVGERTTTTRSKRCSRLLPERSVSRPVSMRSSRTRSLLLRECSDHER